MEPKDYSSNESIMWDIKKMVDNPYVPPIDYGSNSLDPDEHIRQIVREGLAKLTAKQLGETYYPPIKRD